MEILLFDEVADVVRGLAPQQFGAVRTKSHRYGIKLWFDTVKPPREHYEAQVLGAKHVNGAKVLGLEIGFHAEHPDPKLNDEVLGKLLGREPKWRKTLGKEPVAGPFLGARTNAWRRVSETWADPDLGEDELGLEIGSRLIDYVTALEPIIRAK